MTYKYFVINFRNVFHLKVINYFVVSKIYLTTSIYLIIRAEQKAWEKGIYGINVQYEAYISEICILLEIDFSRLVFKNRHIFLSPIKKALMAVIFKKRKAIISKFGTYTDKIYTLPSI